jgi:hypothetical protein
MLANQALKAVGTSNCASPGRCATLRSAEHIDVEPTRLADAGYGPETMSGPR